MMILFLYITQLICCTKYTDHYENKVTQLESLPTCIVNKCVHDDHLNMSNGKLEGQNTENEVSQLEPQLTCIPRESEKQKANGDQDQSHWCPDLRCIIIDMAPVTFIDSSGSRMLERVSMCCIHQFNVCTYISISCYHEDHNSLYF